MSISDKHDRVFKALSAGVRRQILDDLRDQPLTTGIDLRAFSRTRSLHGDAAFARSLRTPTSLTVVRRGRERWNHLNPLPIHEIHERWIGPHASGRVGLLARFKTDLEKDDVR